MANLQQAAAQAAQSGGGGGEESLPDPRELAMQIVSAGGGEYAMQLISELESELQGGDEAASPAAPAEAVASSGRISAQAARGQLS